MKITWMGTASIRIESEGQSILFDPYVQLAGGENPNSLEDFSQETDIFITHGHLDHLVDAAEFLESETGLEATVYCGSVAVGTLAGAAADMSNVVEIIPGNELKVGGISVKVWESRHIKTDLVQKISILFSVRMLRYFKNAIALAYLNKFFKEKGQTYAYEVRAEGKTVFLLGSLGLADHVNYPAGADLLILPFQGCRHPEEKALDIVKRLQPKRVMLDHFDDAFPPITRTVDTKAFKKIMDETLPEIAVVKPVAHKTCSI